MLQGGVHFNLQTRYDLAFVSIMHLSFVIKPNGNMLTADSK